MSSVRHTSFWARVIRYATSDAPKSMVNETRVT
jgi:hypothetical protein